LSLADTLNSLEEVLGGSVTLIDHRGSFRTIIGEPLLGRQWQSHQKNPVCGIDFCERCVQHCRHTVARRGVKEKAPFVTRCWKGVREIATPLFIDEQYVGTLFFGQWRQRALPIAAGHLSGRWRAVYEKLPPWDEAKNAGLLALLAVQARGLAAFIWEARQAAGEMPGRRRQIMDFVVQHACGPVRLKHLAKALHVTESRASHAVQEYCGVSFQELITAERIRAAKVLLTASDLSVAGVAEQVGVPDASHFSKLFKRVVGQSPGKFRKST
jgi:AraC-like DNA-binding protein